MFCPKCLKTNLNYPLITIGEKMFCSNESCFYLTNISNDKSLKEKIDENCPNCLKLNLFSKLISFNGVKFCPNRNCSFMKFVLDEIRETITTTTKIDRKIEKENIASDNHPTVLRCPNCWKSNRLSTNCRLVLRFGLYLCENRNCHYWKSIDQQQHEQINDDHETIDRNILQSTSGEIKIDKNRSIVIEDENRQKLSENSIDNLEIIDLNEELDGFVESGDDSIEKSNDKATGIGRGKPKSLDQSEIDFLDRQFIKHDNRVFNWTRMPYFFKAHSKIVKILLIHLDVFRFAEDRGVFDDLRRQYGSIETVANHYQVGRVKPICYDFLNRLYEAVEKIPNKNLIGKTIDQRTIDLLTLLFEKYDSSNRLKFDYSSRSNCAICEDDRSMRSTGYWISMDRKRHRLKISDNRLSYDVTCGKCRNRSTNSIEFHRVPEFVILHFPKGMTEKEEIDRYDNWITRDGDGRGKLSVVAVVECDHHQVALKLLEYPETPLSIAEYSLTSPIQDSAHRPYYDVHFRNSNGWYNLNGYKSFLSSPTETMCVGSLSNVRFIVLGVVSDPRKYRANFSLSEISGVWLDRIREYYRTFSDNLVENISRKKCSKTKVDKTKPKRKYLKKAPLKNFLKKRPSKKDTYSIDLDQSECNDNYNYEESNLEKPVRNLREKNKTTPCSLSQPIHIDIDKIDFNFNFTESNNQLIENPPQFDHLNYHSRNTLTNSKTSSDVSLSSSLSGIENRPEIPMNHLYHSENVDCSTILVSHQSQKRILDIDDMINEQSKRLKLSQTK